MIFQALHKFAQEHDLLSDIDFAPQRISSYVGLSKEGRFEDVFTVGDKKAPVILPVSKLPPRNSAAIAALGADAAGRVIPGLDPKANGFAIQTQTLFLSQLEAVQAAVKSPPLQTIIHFLQELHQSPSLQEQVIGAFTKKKLKPSDWLTFKVEGADSYLIQWPEVKDWWRQQAKIRREEAAANSNGKTVCMVTGKTCIPVRTHGTNIKVAPGGLAGGVALVSCDKPAFGSYGFDKALVSPMSEEAVEGYIRAINHLGSVDHHHYRTADTNYLFWSNRKDARANPGQAIAEGESNLDFDADNAPRFQTNSSSAKAATQVLSSVSAGNATVTASTDVAERYFCLALSGSAARGIIRAWIDQPLSHALRHVGEWFEDLAVRLDRPIYDSRDKTKDIKKRKRSAETGEIFNRWPLWQLISSLKGKGDSSDAELARLRTLLWQCALLGRKHPVPTEVLATACRRIATTGDCPPARAALIQFLVSRSSSPENPSAMNMNNETSVLHSSAPFLSGRLLRVLNSIQAQALNPSKRKTPESDSKSDSPARLNASLVDKFYTAASSVPSSVLGSLVAKSNSHLAKIRSDRPGLAFYFEEQLTDIIDGIVADGGFRATHNPVEQGQFALGFYYQRAIVKKQKPEADDLTEAAELSTAEA